MAIIDNDGMIRGAVGNYIYRNVNGKRVLQSHPGSLKPKGGTLQENEKFAESSKLAAMLYSNLKHFALNGNDSYLYGRLVVFIKKFLYKDFLYKSSSHYIHLDKDNSLKYFFSELVDYEIDDSKINIHIPAFKPRRHIPKLANAKYMEYHIKLYALSPEIGSVSVVSQYESNRLKVINGALNQNVIIDLDNVDTIFSSQLEALGEFDLASDSRVLFLCFGIHFFEYAESHLFLNSKLFNPSSVLGIWNRE